jgi:hypothetical protein
MNTLRTVWLVAALVLVASVARASGTPDPKILVAGTGYSQTLYGPTFGFAANATGGGNFDFLNNSGQDWTELHITTAMPYGYLGESWVPLDNSEYYDVSSDLFTDSAIRFGASTLTIDLFGLDVEHNGIPTAILKQGGAGKDGWGAHFLISLDNIDTPEVGGWFGVDHAPLSFDASANPVPEPGTFALLLGGLVVGALCYRRGR